jgi:ligand-binding SRPBCC domain-containing protein
MRVHHLRSETWLPRPLDEVFGFHADAANLQAITPPWLDFRILSPLPVQMREGAIIEYRLALRRIPLRWLTEITAWEPPHRFVDEQRRGPYRLWVHEHRFETRDQGTLVSDHVQYAVPLGLLAHWAVVPDLRRIFSYRHEALLRRFGGSLESQPPRLILG